MCGLFLSYPICNIKLSKEEKYRQDFNMGENINDYWPKLGESDFLDTDTTPMALTSHCHTPIKSEQ